MRPTFKKILDVKESTDHDARMQRIAKAKVDVKGPYGKALNQHIDKTGRTRGLKLPPKSTSIAPPYTTTFYKDSAVKGQFKQWSIWTEGRDVITEWGRTGSTLLTNHKTHASPDAANRAMEKIKRTKRLEGYRNNP